MLKTLSTERKIVAAFSGAFAVLCIVSFVSIHSIRTLLNDWASVSHTHQVLEGINGLQADIIGMTDKARAFGLGPTDEGFAEYDLQRGNVEQRYNDLRAFTMDNSFHQTKLDTLNRMLHELTDPTKRTSSPGQIQQIWRLGALRPAIQIILDMNDAERLLLEARDARTRATAKQAFMTIGAAGFLALFLITASGIVIIRDLRNRRRGEIELQRARQAAEAASVAKSAFLANMSHELRTPLTAILGYTDLLMVPASGSQDQNRYLSTMRRSGEHLLNIINDVLDLSKIEAGRMEVELIDCRLIDVLADVDSLMRPRATAKGVDFTVDYASTVPDRVLTDPTRLRQVLVNLVSNAVKFTERGSVRLVVRYDVAGASSTLIIDVADTGIGIAKDQQNILFEPFTQADVTTTRRYGGTGLGLSISRRLALMLGGSLSFTSEPTVGTTFRFALPVSAINGSAMLAPGEMRRFLAAGKPPPEMPQRVSARVLLAEDGPEAREVISLQLERAGCVVTTANDGQVALEVALQAFVEGNPFDIILMDMQMPVMDGFTSTTRLRAEGYKGPIVALTANAMKEDRERCIRAGCDDYVAKPVEVPHLLSVIEKFSGKKPVNHRPIPPTILDDPVLLSLTRKFCDSTSPALDMMRQQLDTNRLDELAATAHKLAGAGGSYGFGDITREAKTLERLAKSAAAREELLNQLARLTATCEGAREALTTATA